MSADTSVSDVRDLAVRQQTLQTGFIKNENRVNSARDAAKTAKGKASNANVELYQLNHEFKNVSTSLESKTAVIGSAKDIAVDLQKRANELATSASNKMANIYGIKISLNYVLTKSILILFPRCGERVRGDRAPPDGALLPAGVSQLRDDDPPAGDRGQVQLLPHVLAARGVGADHHLPVHARIAGPVVQQQDQYHLLDRQTDIIRFH